MSRSYKKTAICGNTTASSEKQDKRIANRRFRRLTRILLIADREPPFSIRQVSNPWDMNKDGRHWFGHLEYRNPRWTTGTWFTRRPHKMTTRSYWLERYRKLMRK